MNDTATNIADYITTITNDPANNDHVWLFGWFAPIRKSHTTALGDEKEINRIWQQWSKNRNLKGYYRMKTTHSDKTHEESRTFEVALFIPDSDIDTICSELRSAFENSDFQAVTISDLTGTNAFLYIKTRVLNSINPADEEIHTPKPLPVYLHTPS